MLHDEWLEQPYNEKDNRNFDDDLAYDVWKDEQAIKKACIDPKAWIGKADAVIDNQLELEAKIEEMHDLIITSENAWERVKRETEKNTMLLQLIFSALNNPTNPHWYGFMNELRQSYAKLIMPPNGSGSYLGSNTIKKEQKNEEN